MPIKIYNQKIPGKTRAQYSRAKAQAKYRKEEWAFTLETWIEKWQSSGRWEHRGREPHHFCMVRLDTIEAWSPKNTIIVTRRVHMRKNGYESLKWTKKTNFEPRHDVSVK